MDGLSSQSPRRENRIRRSLREAKRAPRICVVTPCPGCGAVYATPEENCAHRFGALLALDHARAEPWGSRHGLAFAAYALQHADRFPRNVLERAWLLLFSVYVNRASPSRVTGALRSVGGRAPGWDIARLPSGTPPSKFRVTIADLGSFPAQTYAAQLDLWCQASLDAWRALR